MTEYECGPFSSVARHEAAVRVHSTYFEATGPILKEGTVAARIQALDNAQKQCSRTPPNPWSSSRTELRSSNISTSTASGTAKQDDSRWGYGRRKSLSFAPPASRTAGILGHYYGPPAQYGPASSALAGSTPVSKVEKVGNKAVTVGPKTIQQYEALRPWFVPPKKQVPSEEGPAPSPGSKPAEEIKHAVPTLAETEEEPKPEHGQVAKRKSLVEELVAVIDDAIQGHNEPETEWSDDGPIPESQEHPEVASNLQRSSSGSSMPTVSPERRRSTSDDVRSTAITNSTSSGSDHSKRRRRHRKAEHGRKCSATAETILPRSSSDTDGCPTEEPSPLNVTAESEPTVQRHFYTQDPGHPAFASSSLPAPTTRRRSRRHPYHHHHYHHQRLPRRSTTPAWPEIINKTNQGQESSRSRLTREHEIPAPPQPHPHHHYYHPLTHQHCQPLPHHRHHHAPVSHPPHHPPQSAPQSTAQRDDPPLPVSRAPQIIATLPSRTRFPAPSRHHSLPALAPPLLSPPVGASSLVNPRHLSTSSASTATKKRGWWSLVLGVKNPRASPPIPGPSPVELTDVGHTLRECGHDGDGDAKGEEDIELDWDGGADVAEGQAGGEKEGVEVSGAAGAEADTSGREESSYDGGWSNEKGNGSGVRGVKVVVSLDGGNDLVVEARVRAKRGRD